MPCHALSSVTGNKRAEMEETAASLDFSLHNTRWHTITTEPLIKLDSENVLVGVCAPFCVY